MTIERRDIVVIGAGPGGSAAAHQAALAGVTPLLVEQDEVPGAHNVCGGCAAHALRERFGLPDQVVERELYRTVLVVNGRRFEYGSDRPHYVSFRRELLDAFLADRAVKAGAELLTGTRATIIDPTERLIGLRNLATERERKIKAQIVVFADGPCTLAADAYGIGYRPGPRTRRGAFFELEGTHDDGQTAEIVLSKAFTNGCFWLLPKRECLWLGLGGPVGETRGSPLGSILQRFIQERDDLRWRRIRRRGAGLVPAGPAAVLVSDGAMAVGDAGGLVNPLTGGGIACALASGEIAGRIAADAIRRGRVDRAFLMRYPRAFRFTPHYLCLATMDVCRRCLDHVPPSSRPAAYARMLRYYLSTFHSARRLVDLAVHLPRA